MSTEPKTVRDALRDATEVLSILVDDDGQPEPNFPMNVGPDIARLCLVYDRAAWMLAEFRDRKAAEFACWKRAIPEHPDCNRDTCRTCAIRQTLALLLRHLERQINDLRAGCRPPAAQVAGSRAAAIEERERVAAQEQQRQADKLRRETEALQSAIDRRHRKECGLATIEAQITSAMADKFGADSFNLGDVSRLIHEAAARGYNLGEATANE